MGPRFPHGKGQFWGVDQPNEKHWESLQWCMQPRDHSVLKFNNGMTADCNAPNWLVSHNIVPHEKSAPLHYAVFYQKFFDHLFAVQTTVLLHIVWQSVQ